MSAWAQNNWEMRTLAGESLQSYPEGDKKGSSVGIGRVEEPATRSDPYSTPYTTAPRATDSAKLKQVLVPFDSPKPQSHDIALAENAVTMLGQVTPSASGYLIILFPHLIPIMSQSPPQPQGLRPTLRSQSSP